MTWNNGQYFLLEGWGKKYCTEEYYKYLKSCDKVQNYLPKTSVWSVKNHALELDEKELQKLLYQKLNIASSKIIYTVSAMPDKNCGLSLHNDYENSKEIGVIARGILYLTPKKTSGTLLHYNKNIIEVGGNPGDLLLFEPTEKSWHSAGFSEIDDFRFVSNIMFYK